jgi:hypothetical protein
VCAPSRGIVERGEHAELAVVWRTRENPRRSVTDRRRGPTTNPSHVASIPNLDPIQARVDPRHASNGLRSARSRRRDRRGKRASARSRLSSVSPSDSLRRTRRRIRSFGSERSERRRASDSDAAGRADDAGSGCRRQDRSGQFAVDRFAERDGRSDFVGNVVGRQPGSLPALKTHTSASQVATGSDTQFTVTDTLRSMRVSSPRVFRR